MAAAFPMIPTGWMENIRTIVSRVPFMTKGEPNLSTQGPMSSKHRASKELTSEALGRILRQHLTQQERQYFALRTQGYTEERLRQTLGLNPQQLRLVAGHVRDKFRAVLTREDLTIHRTVKQELARLVGPEDPANEG